MVLIVNGPPNSFFVSLAWNSFLPSHIVEWDTYGIIGPKRRGPETGQGSG